MPIAFNNNCNSFNTPTAFKTSIIRLNGTVHDIYCGLPEDGSILLNPSSGIAPYSYLWSNGDTTINPKGLSAGSYTVTVTDFIGKEATGMYYVHNFPPIDNYFSVTGNRLMTNISGGFPPYTFDWANGGSNDYFSPVVNNQYYSVRVTDSYGCWKEFELVYNSINAVDEHRFKLSVFPNPTTNHEMTIKVNSERNETLLVNFVDQYGQILKKWTIKNTEPERGAKVQLGDASRGVYHLQIIGKSWTISERVIVD